MAARERVTLGCNVHRFRYCVVASGPALGVYLKTHVFPGRSGKR